MEDVVGVPGVGTRVPPFLPSQKERWHEEAYADCIGCFWLGLRSGDDLTNGDLSVSITPKKNYLGSVFTIITAGSAV
ncbi:MAG: hypothetical protein ACE15C_04145, partial [Phycisphaerae bacterium]